MISLLIEEKDLGELLEYHIAFQQIFQEFEKIAFPLQGNICNHHPKE